MSQVTIGAAIITGPNTLASLKELLPQLSELDQVVIVDSSNQGAIYNYVKKFKNVTYKAIAWRPSAVSATGEKYGLNEWGFAYARNESFKLLNTTHAIWLDADDKLGLYVNSKEHHATATGVKEALRKIATDAPNTDLWFVDYVYSQDGNGNANVLHARERIVKLECGWEWVYPIHECLVPAREPKHAVIKDLKIFHYPDPDRPSSSERNLRYLLEWLEQLQEHPAASRHDLSRCRMLIGETYWGMQKYDIAEEWLRLEYLGKHPDALDLEKWVALCFIARSNVYLGDLKKARRAALDAIDVEPGLMDGYLLLAEIKMMAEEDPQDVLLLIETGAGKEKPPPQVIQNPLDYDFLPFLVASEAKFQLGQFDAALEYAIKALKEVPDHSGANKARLKAADAVRKRDASRAATALYEYLLSYDENEKAAQLYQFLPYEVQHDAGVYELAKAQAARTQHISSVKHFAFLHNQEAVPDYAARARDKVLPNRDLYKYVQRRFAKHGIKPGAEVLVVEQNDLALQLARDGYFVTAVDIHKTRAAAAQEQALAEGLTFTMEHAMFEIMELHPKGWVHRFDAVLATDYLHKCQKPGPAVGSLGDCAKDEAPIIIAVPNGAWDRGDIPMSRDDNSAKTLRSFTQAALEDFLITDTEYHLFESHYLPYSAAYREEQGWQVAELRRTIHPNGPVVRIFCGDACQPFSPDNLVIGDGIGGSETAVIQLAHHLAELGAQVAVYGVTVGIWDGVFYRHAQDFVLEQKSNLFIAWRLPHMFRHGRPNADVTVLWNHDLYYPMLIEEEWVQHIDKIAVLSEFHKEYLNRVHPVLPLDKMWITRNGIDPGRYVKPVEKVPYNYFFTSSYERGLKELIKLWPDVRKEIPEAVLHVAYGTKTAEIMAKGNPEKMHELTTFFTKVMNMDGVVNHGRLNQKQLAELHMSCEAWLYPYQWIDEWYDNGGFLETACITKFEAMAAGAIPITRLNGALPERLPHCIEWKKDWTVENLIDVLKNIDKYWDSEWTEENRREALENYRWDTLAVEWLKQLRPDGL